uniref:Uncharacterized protein n=1 Tax=Triticum urartu TaxID=4572 RepID=A0A8R7PXV3_TRIUA
MMFADYSYLFWVVEWQRSEQAISDVVAVCREDN